MKFDLFIMSLETNSGQEQYTHYHQYDDPERLQLQIDEFNVMDIDYHVKVTCYNTVTN